ncbi:hypothetical protein OG394_29585 [Kribbella sp. NBC_01245]|uniref:hypothetical protein n=1 Tax=Kribbella sp. NBC_01245 TaxID=2903578 RepID=UPI002E2B0C64|nr:hypothetical protein [Kribbella sp. NBC_01245]
MRDFTSRSNNDDAASDQLPLSKPADTGIVFDDAASADDLSASGILKKSISDMAGPHGIRSITFVEPQEIVDARAHIRHRENNFLHVTDGTPDGCLCGYRAQHAPPKRAPDCPVCQLLDC